VLVLFKGICVVFWFVWAVALFIRWNLVHGLNKAVRNWRSEKGISKEASRARQRAIDVAAEAYDEFNTMRKHLFEIRRDPRVAEKVWELLPLLRFADWRYAATYPDTPFVLLEMIAEKMCQGHSLDEGDESFDCHR